MSIHITPLSTRDIQRLINMMQTLALYGDISH